MYYRVALDKNVVARVCMMDVNALIHVHTTIYSQIYIIYKYIYTYTKRDKATRQLLALSLDIQAFLLLYIMLPERSSLYRLLLNLTSLIGIVDGQTLYGPLFVHSASISPHYIGHSISQSINRSTPAPLIHSSHLPSECDESAQIYLPQ
jgi:hypothetical protein